MLCNHANHLIVCNGVLNYEPSRLQIANKRVNNRISIKLIVFDNSDA